MSALAGINPDRFHLSSIGAQSGFEVSVWSPATPAETLQDAPVLYVMDGDVLFSMVVEIVRYHLAVRELQPVIVVGVGYDAEPAEFLRLRMSDLTPPLSKLGRQQAGSAWWAPRDMPTSIGGADLTLTFLTDVLAPEIARRYPQSSSHEKYLYGHSLGGLFTCHALLMRPDAFTGFLVSSPSLHWDNFGIFSSLPALGERVRQLALSPRVLIGVGGAESIPPAEVHPLVDMTLPELQRFVAQVRMVDASTEFADRLRDTGIEMVEFARFEGENHTSVVPAAITRGLNAVLKQLT